jgi:hypothetical protein
MFPPNENPLFFLPSWGRILALALCVAFAAPTFAAEPAASADIVVVSVRGEVRVTMSGAAREVRAGSIVELPATVRTGRDGAIDLRQGNTTVAIAAETELRLPATAPRGAILDVLIQTRGNAFYDVGKRTSQKLRVETPYLVAVIKGTQFNVAVQEASATISLFEGRLEVRTPDGSDVVDLNAGEIAMRHATDKAIRVLRMDSGKAPATTSNETGKRSIGPAEPDVRSDTPRVVTPTDDGNNVLVAGVVPRGNDITLELDVRANGAGNGLSLEAGNGTLAAAASAKLGDGLSLELDAGIGAGDVRANADVDLGAGSADIGAAAAVDLGAASIDTALDAGIDLGAGTVNLGTEVGADLGVAGVDAGLDASIDLGAGAVDASTGVAADLGVAAVDTTLDAGLDPAVGVDAGFDASLAGIDVGADVALDLGSGDLGLDVGIGGLDVGLGAETAPAPAPAPDTAPDPDLGGLLGGLLGRRGGN